MGSRHLIDSIASHISLYHTSSISNPNPNPNPRSSILKWFNSLTPDQRCSHLTILDPPFVRLLLKMDLKIRSNGHGLFIILPDLPDHSLPSLCYRSSPGLLSRASLNPHFHFLRQAILIFSSSEDQTCLHLHPLDTLTISQGFMSQLDLFVSSMDWISSGRFLRGDDPNLGSDWAEMGWLKELGYYSVEAFLANRIEVALRIAWERRGGGRRRGVGLKDKVGSAGIAANVFWRKKGCLDWWGALDGEIKMKVISTVLGKVAKSMTGDILQGANNVMGNEMCVVTTHAGEILRFNSTNASRRTISRKFCSLPSIFRDLLVLQDILTVFSSCQKSVLSIEQLFFSTLGSVNTIFDCVLRKLRDCLMILSLECTKLELLGEENIYSCNKSKESFGVGGRRKKKAKDRNKKKVGIGPILQGDDLLHGSKPPQDHEYGTVRAENVESSSMPCILYVGDTHKEILLPAVEKDHALGSIEVNVQSTARKNRKGRRKNKKCNLVNLHEEINVETKTLRISSSSLVSRGEDETCTCESDISAVQSMPYNGNFVSPEPTLSSCNLSSEIILTDDATHSIQEDFVISHSDLMHAQPTSNGHLKMNVLNHNDSVMNNEEISFCDSGHLDEIDTRSVSHAYPKKITYAEDKFAPPEKNETENFYHTGQTNYIGYSSSEWPSVNYVTRGQFPSVNSQHLPTATDRLHLDAGHNWHNHFHQAFVPTVHQTRNSPVESAHGRILPRQLPMSLDWPPMVRNVSGLTPPMTYNYDSGFVSRRWQGFPAHSLQINATIAEAERKYSGDFVDMSDLTNIQDLTDEFDSHWVSEEEIDYNQYFGGGVMYWNPSDHPGSGFSRPPSLSSDDSSWARHEADMNRAIDDMVAFPSSFSTNGLTSPTATPFCSSFDTLGYVIPANEVNGKVLHSSLTIPDEVVHENVSGSLVSLPGDVDGKTEDSLPYPILRPIIIPNMSRERSRFDSKRSHNHKSPCVPPTRREQPRNKRPPSPVVLCVPRAPCPPPPSPVSDSKKHKGFPPVRSGSSSPRQWGIKGWYQDGTYLDEALVCMDGTEVIWPWTNKSLSACSMIQPLPGPLLQDRLMTISQLARDQEHPDVAFSLQPPDLVNCSTRKPSLFLMHNLLHNEIESFCKRVTVENMIRKPFINWAIKRVTRSLQVLWPRSRTNLFGSSATGLSLPTSDVDLVISLPPVRNLEPIKEAGILEGRNGIKETCLQHAARYLANQEWVKSDSLKTVENTAIPIIMLVVAIPHDLITPCASNVQMPKDGPTPMAGEHDNRVHNDLVGTENSILRKGSSINYDSGVDVQSIRVDISFKSSSHTGLQTTKLVKELTEQFPAAIPLALVLKKFLADRSLDQSYSGGLSSYCLVLMIIRFFQHEHHLGRPINQNYGSLLMDFLYFFGNIFDPRQMRISVQGSGVYIKREKGHSIDPIHIDDPLFPTNNVGRNCFRIHQCIKAFSDAFVVLENEVTCLASDDDSSNRPVHKLLNKIVPSINNL